MRPLGAASGVSGRCYSCQWSFYRHEKICPWCLKEIFYQPKAWGQQSQPRRATSTNRQGVDDGQWHANGQNTQQVSGKGKGGRRLPIFSKNHLNQQSLRGIHSTGKGGKAPSSEGPPPVDKVQNAAEPTDPQPEEVPPDALQKMLQISEKELGPNDPHTQALRRRHQQAVAARQHAKDPEVKLIAARNKTQRIQQRIARAEENIQTKKDNLQAASDQLDESIAHLDRLKIELEEARKQHAEAASEVQSKPANLSDAKTLLQFAGFTLPGEPTAGMGSIIEGMQAHLNAFQELINKHQQTAGAGGSSASAPDDNMSDVGEGATQSKRASAAQSEVAPTPKRGKTSENKKSSATTPKASSVKGADSPGRSCP